MAGRGQITLKARRQAHDERVAAYRKLSPAEQLASVQRQNAGHPEWEAKRQRARIVSKMKKKEDR